MIDDFLLSPANSEHCFSFYCDEEPIEKNGTISSKLSKVRDDIETIDLTIPFKISFGSKKKTLEEELEEKKPKTQFLSQEEFLKIFEENKKNEKVDKFIEKHYIRYGRKGKQQPKNVIYDEEKQDFIKISKILKKTEEDKEMENLLNDKDVNIENFFAKDMVDKKTVELIKNNPEKSSEILKERMILKKKDVQNEQKKITKKNDDALIVQKFEKFTLKDKNEKQAKVIKYDKDNENKMKKRNLDLIEENKKNYYKNILKSKKYENNKKKRKRTRSRSRSRSRSNSRSRSRYHNRSRSRERKRRNRVRSRSSSRTRSQSRIRDLKKKYKKQRSKSRDRTRDNKGKYQNKHKHHKYLKDYRNKSKDVIVPKKDTFIVKEVQRENKEALSVTIQENKPDPDSSLLSLLDTSNKTLFPMITKKVSDSNIDFDFYKKRSISNNNQDINGLKEDSKFQIIEKYLEILHSDEGKKILVSLADSQNKLVIESILNGHSASSGKIYKLYSFNNYNVFIEFIEGNRLRILKSSKLN